jgi:hypothetical protein
LFWFNRRQFIYIGTMKERLTRRLNLRGFVAYGGPFMLATCLLIGPTGCAGGPAVDASEIAVSAHLDRGSYRPGQAVVCSVSIKNATRKDLPVPFPNARCVEFHCGLAGTDVRLKRDAVRSPKEEGFRMVPLKPGQTLKRRFVLTRVTEQEGTHALHVFYHPAKAAEVLGPKYIAPTIGYHVAGPVLFHRDAKGILLKKDAAKVAVAKAGGGDAKADAVLVRNEAGLLEWWVNVVRSSGGGREPAGRTSSYLVCAYRGTVRASAKPHESRPEEED